MYEEFPMLGVSGLVYVGVCCSRPKCRVEEVEITTITKSIVQN